MTIDSHNSDYGYKNTSTEQLLKMLQGPALLDVYREAALAELLARGLTREELTPYGLPPDSEIESKETERKPAQEVERPVPKGFFSSKLTGWQLLAAFVVVGWLVYDKYQASLPKVQQKVPIAIVPLTESDFGPDSPCKRYSEAITGMVGASGGVLISPEEKLNTEGFKNQVFMCSFQDPSSGRSGFLRAERFENPAKVLAAQFESSRKVGKPVFVVPEPSLGSAGFSHRVDWGDGSPILEYVALAHSDTLVVDVNLRPMTKTARGYSDEDQERVKRLLAQVTRDFSARK